MIRALSGELFYMLSGPITVLLVGIVIGLVLGALRQTIRPQSALTETESRVAVAHARLFTMPVASETMRLMNAQDPLVTMTSREMPAVQSRRAGRRRP